MNKSFQIDSRFLGEKRSVHVIQPPNFACEEKRIALFCTDGQSADAFVSKLNDSSLAASTLVIGVESNPSTRDYDYVSGYHPERFDAHENFCLHEVFSELSKKLEFDDASWVVGIAGYSNGGTFAHSMVARHPDLFSFGIIFSAADNRVRLDQYKNCQNTRLYLAAGLHEPEYFNTTQLIANDLSSAGIQNFFAKRDAGHEMNFWSSELPIALQWIFDS